jgi:hypothetical protein
MRRQRRVPADRQALIEIHAAGGDVFVRQIERHQLHQTGRCVRGVRTSGEHDVTLPVERERGLGAQARSRVGIGAIQAMLERPPGHLRIGEAVHPPGDLLPRLGALAKQDDDVAGRGPGDGELDRARPIRLDADRPPPARGDTLQDTPDDGPRILTARIVAGDDDRVGNAGRDRPISGRLPL